MGGPQRFRGGEIIKNGTKNGRIGYITPAAWGVPNALERGKHHKWPTTGQIGCATPAARGVPNASRRGTKSYVAHGGPQMGGLATPPLPYGGSPTLHSGRQKQKCPTSVWIGFVTPAAWSPQPFIAGDKIRSGRQVGTWPILPRPSEVSQALQSGGQNQKWPTSGRIGYITPALWGAATLHNGGRYQKWPTSGQIG